MRATAKKNQRHNRRRYYGMSAIAALIVLVAGCGRTDGPKTYPVTGQVVFKQGQPLRGGMLQFQSLDFPNVTTVGEIKPDGSFSLYTVAGTTKLPGAVPGKHQVTVILPPNKRNENIPVRLSQQVVVKADDTNAITIKLPQSS